MHSCMRNRCEKPWNVRQRVEDSGIKGMSSPSPSFGSPLWRFTLQTPNSLVHRCQRAITATSIKVNFLCLLGPAHGQVLPTQILKVRHCGIEFSCDLCVARPHTEFRRWGLSFLQFHVTQHLVHISWVRLVPFHSTTLCRVPATCSSVRCDPASSHIMHLFLSTPATSNLTQLPP